MPIVGLGAKLFSRHARGVRLNPLGRAYLEDIQRIFAQLNAVTELQRHRPEDNV